MVLCIAACYCGCFCGIMISNWVERLASMSSSSHIRASVPALSLMWTREGKAVECNVTWLVHNTVNMHTHLLLCVTIERQHHSRSNSVECTLLPELLTTLLPPSSYNVAHPPWPHLPSQCHPSQSPSLTPDSVGPAPCHSLPPVHCPAHP